MYGLFVPLFLCPSSSMITYHIVDMTHRMNAAWELLCTIPEKRTSSSQHPHAKWYSPPPSTTSLPIPGTTRSILLKEVPPLLMLCAPVFMFTSGSSALSWRPLCGLLIWMSLLDIFNTRFWVYALFLWGENGLNTRILELRHFCMIIKWPPTVTRRAKH